MGKAWFRQKRYGLGLTLCSWEGWALCLAFLIASITAFAVARPGQGEMRPVAWIAFALLMIGFIVVAYAKSEGKTAWRWGGRK